MKWILVGENCSAILCFPVALQKNFASFNGFKNAFYSSGIWFWRTQIWIPLNVCPDIYIAIISVFNLFLALKSNSIPQLLVSDIPIKVTALIVNKKISVKDTYNRILSVLS